MNESLDHLNGLNLEKPIKVGGCLFKSPIDVFF